MTRERIGQAALRAYPPAVRQTRGLEMLGMLLDAGERSGRAFVSESASLVLGGLRERGAITARAGSRRLFADACCQAVMLFLMLWLFSALNTAVIAGPNRQLVVQGAVPAAILVCALIGYERIAAVGGLATISVIVASRPLGLHDQPVPLATELVPLTCLLVMVRAPQRRPRDRRQLLWLLPFCVPAALHTHVSLPEVLALISIGGLLRLLLDPRLAIACCLVWIILLSSHTSRVAPANLHLLVLPAVMVTGLLLTVAARRLWIMRHSATA